MAAGEGFGEGDGFGLEPGDGDGLGEGLGWYPTAGSVGFMTLT
jgi:hypothetical protein